MNTSSSRHLASALLALGCVASSDVLAQPAMQQGNHAIMIEQTKKVLADVAELKEQTKGFQSDYDAAKAREAGWTELVQAADTPDEKRREAQARGLEERANLVLAIKGQMGRSIATYQSIAAGLDRIIGAAEEGTMKDNQAQEAQRALAATLDQGFTRDEEIYALVGRELETGKVPGNVTRAFRDSRQRMLASREAVKRLNGAFDKKAFGQQMRAVRDNVHSRLVHYETVRLITEHQLGNISTVAMVNQLTLMSDEISAEIGEILTTDDPLGLETLKPGSEFDYLATPASTAADSAPATQRGGSLTAADFARPKDR